MINSLFPDGIAFRSVLTRGLGTLVQLIFTIYIGRMLGAEALGIFYIYYSWINFISTFISFGHNAQIIKKVSIYNFRGFDSAEIKLITKSIFFITIAGSLVYLITVFFSIDIANRFFDDNNLISIPKYSAMGGIIFALIKIISDSFKAKKKVSFGLFLEFVLPFTSLLIVLIICRLTSYHILIMDIIFIHLTVSFFIMITSLVYLFFSSYKDLFVNLDWLKINEPFEIKILLKFWLIMLFNNLLSIGPYLILPFYVTNNDIGHFSIANRFVAITASILFALGSYYGPQFSRIFSENNSIKLLKSYRSSQKYSILFCLPLLTIYLYAPKILIKIYGADFLPAIPLLLIMATGRIINAIVGLSEHFLNMTGNEQWELLSTFLSVILFFFLSFFQISSNSIGSVAWAFTIAVSFKSLFSYIRIYNFTNAK